MHLKIDDQDKICTFINTFHTTPDKQRELADSLNRFFDKTRVLKGFIGAATHLSIDGQRVVNYVQWQTREDLQAMLQLPDSKEHLAEVGAWAVKVEPMFYQVDFVGSLQA